MDRDLHGRLKHHDLGDGVISRSMRKKVKVLNLGCGFVKIVGAVNVDKFENCEPDVLHDLDDMPWPFNNESFDVIYLDHVLEHLRDWWGALRECARILKIGGSLAIFVPDESNCHAMAYRDHLHIFTVASFHNFADGTCDRTGTNAFAKYNIEHYGPIPMRMAYYKRVPFKRYNWLEKWFPWLMKFCGNHMRNFIDEQHVGFERIPAIGGKN